MRPQEIEKIAESVVMSFSQDPESQSVTGCGSFSTPAYNCPDVFSCESDYQCGGLCEFACSQTFTCTEGFFCACVYTEPPIP